MAVRWKLGFMTPSFTVIRRAAVRGQLATAWDALGVIEDLARSYRRSQPRPGWNARRDPTAGEVRLREGPRTAFGGLRGRCGSTQETLLLEIAREACNPDRLRHVGASLGSPVQMR